MKMLSLWGVLVVAVLAVEGVPFKSGQFSNFEEYANSFKPQKSAVETNAGGSVQVSATVQQPVVHQQQQQQRNKDNTQPKYDYYQYQPSSSSTPQQNYYNHAYQNSYDTLQSVQNIIPQRRPSKPLYRLTQALPPPIRNWFPQLSNNRPSSLLPQASQGNRRVARPLRRRPYPLIGRLDGIKKKCYTLYCQVRDAFTSFIQAIF